MKSCIDIGSNSVHLLIGDYENEKAVEKLHRVTITSLSKDLDKTQKFSQQSMEKTFSTLQEYKNDLEAHGLKAEDTFVTATEASRVATNASEFYQKVESDLGFKTHIITGEQEAYFTALGVSKGMSDSSIEKFTLLDVGGASSEITFAQTDPFKVNDCISLPVGAVRASDWMRQDQFEENLESIFKEYETSLGELNCEKLVCSAGTMTSLATMYQNRKDYSAKQIHGLELKVDEFKQFITKYDTMGPEELLQEFPFLGKRAPYIMAGANVALRIAEKIQAKTLEITVYGLRYGTLYQGRI